VQIICLWLGELGHTQAKIMRTATCCSPYIFLVHWFLLVSYRCQLGWLQLNFMFHSWWLGFRVRVLALIFQMQHFVGRETITKAWKNGLVTIVTWFFLRWKDLFIWNLIARHKADAVWSLHSFILLLSFIRAHVVPLTVLPSGTSVGLVMTFKYRY